MMDFLLAIITVIVILCGVACLYFSRLLPVFPILGGLLVARVLFDGIYKFPVLGANVTGLLGVAILLLAAGVLMTGLKGAVWFILILGLLYWSNLQGQVSFGPAIGDEYVRFASVLGVFFIARNLRKRPSSKSVIYLIQYLGLVSACFSVIQFLTGTGMQVQGVVRIAGTMAHPNSAALLYAICLTLSIVGAVGRLRRRWNLGMAFVFAGALLITGSMGGILACLTMLATFGLASRGLPSRVRMLTIFVMMVTALTFILSPLGAARLTEFSDLSLSGSGPETNSLEWRIGRWFEILNYWRDSPYLGQGFGASTTGEMLNGYPPHNEYVRILVELGFFGLLSALVFVWISWRRLRQASRTGSDASTLSAMAMAVFVGMLLNGVSENTFMYSVPSYVLALLLGLVWDFRPDSDVAPYIGVARTAFTPRGSSELSLRRV